MVRAVNRRAFLGALAFALALVAGCSRSDDGIVVLAAASLEPHLGPLLAERGGGPVSASWGASSALAHQVRAGVPADLVIFADDKEAPALAAEGLLDAETLAPFVRNRMVVVASRPLLVPTRPNLQSVARLMDLERVAVADPALAPLGRYTREALEHGGVLEELEPKLVPFENARVVWSQIENATCDVGIVYATDVPTELEKSIVLRIDPALHQPIVYMIALTANAKPEARALFDELRGEPVMRALTAKGFLPPSGE
jgi:molybdate transport system substrate-binding protein